MRHHIHKMAWFTWIVVVVLTGLFALLVTFLRIVTPMLQNYTEQIKIYLNQSIQHPVHLGEIQSDWYGFGPVIEINDFKIYDNERKNILLSADHARLRFSLFELLRHLSLVPTSLSIENGNITLTYSENHKWSVLGFGEEKPQEGNESIFEWTPARQRINLDNFTVHVQAYNGVTYEFDKVNGLLSDDGTTTQIDLEANWNQPIVSKMKLIGEFNSKGIGRGRLEGRLYSYLSYADWSALAIFAPEMPAQLEKGQGSLELWADWLAGSLYKVQTEVNWKDLVVQFPQTPAPLAIDKLQGTFVWLAPEKNQWIFLGNNVILEANNISTLATNFKWSHNIGKENANVIEMENINLATLTTILKEIPEVSPYQQQFIQLSPSGYLKNFHLDTQTTEHMPVRFNIQSDFSNLSFAGLAPIQKISGVSGTIDSNEKIGKLVLASENMSIDLPDFFSEKIDMDKLDASIGWENTETGWKVGVNQFNLVANPNEQVTLRGMLNWPHDPNISPFIELLATVPDIQLKDAMDFVPDKKLSPKFASWLEQAFPKGWVENATLVIRGPTRDFPFANGEGKFEIHAFLHDTTLSYHPQWPKVEDIQAELVFSGHRMDATILEGTVSDAKIQKSIVSIPYIGSEQPMIVEVPGVLTGTADAGMKFLKESPLWDKLGADLSSLVFNGPIQVNLDLAFPLDQPDVPPTVLGTIALDQAQVVIPELDLSFEKVVGVLGFSDKAVTAHNLQAQLFGNKTKIDIDTISQPNQPDYLQFRVAGSADADILEHRYPDPIWKNLKGTVHYNALLERHHAPDPVPSWFVMSSDLKGLQVNLPVPFNKAAANAEEFYYRTSVGVPGHTEVQIKYADKLVGHLEVATTGKKSQVKKGALVVNSGQMPPLPKGAGLQVTGKLPELSLDDWIPFVSEYIAEREKEKRAADIQLNVQAKLEVNTLALLQQKWLVQSVEASSQGNVWQFKTQGKDVQGLIDLGSANKAIQIHLDHLYWISKSEEPKKVSPSAGQNQQSFPTANITVDNLFLNQRLLGKVYLSTINNPKGLQIQEVKVVNSHYTFAGDGEWLQRTTPQATHIQGKMDTKDLGKALQYWGINTDIQDAHGNAEFQLSWPGGPADFQLNTFSGDALVHIEDGRILEINPGGIGRILALVNLDSLKRRLRLDFSDVLKQGFTFDDVKGHFSFKSGIATTEDTLISSSATKIAVKGNIDMVKQALDLRIIVMPHLTGPLPIAAAIAVNPIVGVAVWAADKIIGPELQQLTQYWYRVTGPWQSPKVEPIDREAPTIRRKR